jgi:hypothetical protein
MTINNGTVDLSDPNPFIDLGGFLPGELLFVYEYIGPQTAGGSPVGPKNEKYSINFTGPGQFIVDNGIFVLQQAADQGYQTPPHPAPEYFTPITTYEDLWDLGILQANGKSGLTPGEVFSDYFTVSGSPGLPDYTLTSLVAPPGQDGDHNGDGVVDLADYVTWRKDPANFGGTPDGYDEWRQNFGEPGGGGGGAVPEPVGFVLAMIGLAILCFGRRHFRVCTP